MLAPHSHPNLAILYCLEYSDGKRSIVMELVEGLMLTHRLQKGPFHVQEALEDCRHIAEVFEAAHDRGVIHRDMKPANIQLAPDGKVKILAFGPAQAFHEQPLEVDQTHSPPITDAMTRAGTILGTTAYMNRAQAKGKAVDERTDIGAFRCVLKECLTAKPFQIRGRVRGGEELYDSRQIPLEQNNRARETAAAEQLFTPVPGAGRVAPRQTAVRIDFADFVTTRT